MKTFIFILITSLSTLTIYGNIDTTYYPLLKDGLKKADSAYEFNNYLNLAYVCERIIKVKNKEWLPYYYAAYAYIHMCFLVKDNNKKVSYCDKAQYYLDKAFELQKDESELFVLQALLYFGRMEVNPFINGMEYYPKAKDALKKAEILNSDNPRIFYLRGQILRNTPEFMGGGDESAIPVFETALSKYEKFVLKSCVHPYWGKEHTMVLYKECKNNIK